MKYLKKFNEGNTNVINDIDEILDQKINFSLNKPPLNNGVHTYIIEINHSTLTIECGAENGPALYLNGEYMPDFEVSVHKISDLYDHLVSMYSRSLTFINYIRYYIDKSSSELRDRCLEFEITKDNKYIDEISLQQLFEYYGEDWNFYGYRVIEGLKNYKFIQ